MTGLPRTRPLSIAHRGASAYAPENTVAGFRKAALLGADMWEVDIRVTADGQVVCYHDAKLPDGRAVRDLTWDQIRAARPDLPLWSEVVALARELGAGLYADIKDVDAALPTLEGVRANRIAPVILGAFSPEVVRILREADSEFPVSGLVPLGADPLTHAPEADVVHPCWERMERPQDMLTPALFGEIFARGQRMVLWHEEDPDRMAAIRVKPVDGICSDRPELINPFRPPSDWPVGVVCHRGANRIAPENTLPALECALAAGFSHIEVDLHITTDGEIVVIHDDRLDRTTDATGPVTDRTLAELRALDAGGWFDPFFAGTPIPTLDEVLALAKKYHGKIYLELKSAPPGPVWDKVVQAGLQDAVFFWSFNRDFLVELRALAPEARIMARRQDYPTLPEAMDHYGASVIEFLPNDDPFEIASLRGSAVASMVAYMGDDERVLRHIVDLRPDIVNLDQPFAFARALTAD